MTKIDPLLIYFVKYHVFIELFNCAQLYTFQILYFKFIEWNIYRHSPRFDEGIVLTDKPIVI